MSSTKKYELSDRKIYEFSDSYLDYFLSDTKLHVCIIGESARYKEWAQYDSNMIYTIGKLNKYIEKFKKIKQTDVDYKVIIGVPQDSLGISDAEYKFIVKNKVWILNCYSTIEESLKYYSKFFANKSYYRDVCMMESIFLSIFSCFQYIKLNNLSALEIVLEKLKTIETPINQYISLLRAGMKEKKLNGPILVNSIIDLTKTLEKDFGSEIIKKIENMDDTLFKKSKQSKEKYIEELENILIKHVRSSIRDYRNFLRCEYLVEIELNNIVDYIGKDLYVDIARSYLGISVDVMALFNEGLKEVKDIYTQIELLSEKIKQKMYNNKTIEQSEKDKIKEMNLLDFKRYLDELPEFKLNNSAEFIEWAKKLQLDTMNKLKNDFYIPEIAKKIDIVESYLDVSGISYLQTNEIDRNGTIEFKFVEGEFISKISLESTMYHEGFPGHHLQLCTQIENKKYLTDFIRYCGPWAGFAEGWGLYSEKIMEEYNLYSCDEAILGMKYMSLMRACRILVDIGMHLQLSLPNDYFYKPGKLIDYSLCIDMLHNLAGQSIELSESEAKRYLSIPGQAISYKIGEWEILKLRKKYTKDGKMSIKDFHKMILQFGTVIITTFETLCDMYIIDHPI